MNQQFYALARDLNASQLTEDRHVYFGSILGTLNHIMVGDIVWLKRFAQHPVGFQSLDVVRTLETPDSLDATLHKRLMPLSQLRSVLDETIVAFVDELDERALSTNLNYANFKGVQHTKPFSLLLLHFFNHQTHHRGQVSALFSQAGLDIGVTDLLLDIPSA